MKITKPDKYPECPVDSGTYCWNLKKEADFIRVDYVKDWRNCVICLLSNLVHRFTPGDPANPDTPDSKFFREPQRKKKHELISHNMQELIDNWYEKTFDKEQYVKNLIKDLQQLSVKGSILNFDEEKATGDFVNGFKEGVNWLRDKILREKP